MLNCLVSLASVISHVVLAPELIINICNSQKPESTAPKSASGSICRTEKCMHASARLAFWDLGPHARAIYSKIII